MDRFWNERMETMDPAERRDLESQRLARQMVYNHATSPLLAAKMAEVGALPGDIRTVDDLALLPFMEKHEIADSQAGGAISARTSAPRSRTSCGSRAPAGRPASRCESA